MSKLKVTKTGDVIQVTQTLRSALESSEHFWYYNLETRMKSSYAKEGDECDYPMNQADVDWVTTHYVPMIKIEKPKCVACGSSNFRMYRKGDDEFQLSEDGSKWIFERSNHSHTMNCIACGEEARVTDELSQLPTTINETV